MGTPRLFILSLWEAFAWKNTMGAMRMALERCHGLHNEFPGGSPQENLLGPRSFCSRDIRRAFLLCGRTRYLLCGHTRDFLCGHTRDLLCGHTRDLSCDHTRDLLCGPTRDLLCGRTVLIKMNVSLNLIILDYNDSLGFYT